MRVFATISAIVAVAATVGCAGRMPTYEAPAIDAEFDEMQAVDAENLYLREAYWPSIVLIDRAWQPPEATEPPTRYRQGTLVRVRENGDVRIDFSSAGKFWVPVEATDAVERAESIRRGEQAKVGPNLARMLGNRLLDAREARPIPYREAIGRFDELVLVYVDPLSEDFERIAQALKALHIEEERAVFVLLPRGNHRTATVLGRALQVGWPGAYVARRYVEAYTEALLEDGDASKAMVQRLTPEGRLLYQAEWHQGAQAAIELALGVEDG